MQAIGNVPVKINPNMDGEVSSPTQDVHTKTAEIIEK